MDKQNQDVPSAVDPLQNVHDPTWGATPAALEATDRAFAKRLEDLEVARASVSSTAPSLPLTPHPKRLPAALTVNVDSWLAPFLDANRTEYSPERFIHELVEIARVLNDRQSPFLAGHDILVSVWHAVRGRYSESERACDLFDEICSSNPLIFELCLFGLRGGNWRLVQLYGPAWLCFGTFEQPFVFEGKTIGNYISVVMPHVGAEEYESLSLTHFIGLLRMPKECLRDWHVPSVEFSESAGNAARTARAWIANSPDGKLAKKWSELDAEQVGILCQWCNPYAQQTGDDVTRDILSAFPKAFVVDVALQAIQRVWQRMDNPRPNYLGPRTAVLRPLPKTFRNYHGIWVAHYALQGRLQMFQMLWDSHANEKALPDFGAGQHGAEQWYHYFEREQSKRPAMFDLLLRFPDLRPDHISRDDLNRLIAELRSDK